MRGYLRAYADLSTELKITRMGDVITIFPARGRLQDDIATLRAMPKPPPSEAREPIEIPDRTWD